VRSEILALPICYLLSVSAICYLLSANCPVLIQLCGLISYTIYCTSGTATSHQAVSEYWHNIIEICPMSKQFTAFIHNVRSSLKTRIPNLQALTLTIHDLMEDTRTVSSWYHEWCARYHEWCARYHEWCARYHEWCARYHEWCVRYHEWCVRYHEWCVRYHEWCLRYYMLRSLFSETKRSPQSCNLGIKGAVAATYIRPLTLEI
jgi:hypothetical protein